jgi:hypothetical protein
MHAAALLARLENPRDRRLETFIRVGDNELVLVGRKSPAKFSLRFKGRERTSIVEHPTMQRQGRKLLTNERRQWVSRVIFGLSTNWPQFSTSGHYALDLDCYVAGPWRLSLSNRDPLDLIERDFIAGAIVELRRARAGVIGHRLGVFERAAVGEKIRQPGRP